MYAASMNRAASDPQGQARVEAFKQGLQQLGWSQGRNVQIDVGWGEDDADIEHKKCSAVDRAGAPTSFLLVAL